MYAIIETGGKQYRVKPGDTIAVERLAGEPGETLELDRVLLVGGDGERARVGAPGVANAIVRAEVVEHARGEKIIVFRYKSKVRYRRKTGHRQALTRLRITDILVDGASAAPRKAETTPTAPAEAEAPTTTRRRRAATATAPAAAAAAEPEVDEAAAAPVEVESPAPVEEEAMPPAAAEAGPTPDEAKEE
jgi:large subunit ribosomal protein L21